MKENTNYINSLEAALEILMARNNAGHVIDMGVYLNLVEELINEETTYV